SGGTVTIGPAATIVPSRIRTVPTTEPASVCVKRRPPMRASILGFAGTALSALNREQTSRPPRVPRKPRFRRRGRAASMNDPAYPVRGAMEDPSRWRNEVLLLRRTHSSGADRWLSTRIRQRRPESWHGRIRFRQPGDAHNRMRTLGPTGQGPPTAAKESSLKPPARIGKFGSGRPEERTEP